MRRLGYLAGAVALLLATSVTNGFAGGAVVTPVPEINPSSALGGLGLLTAGVLLLRARFRK